MPPLLCQMTLIHVCWCLVKRSLSPSELVRQQQMHTCEPVASTLQLSELFSNKTGGRLKCSAVYLFCRMRQTSQQIISPKLSNSCEWIKYCILVYGVNCSFYSRVDHLHLILFVNLCLCTNSHQYIESNCCLLHRNDTGESTGPISACSCLCCSYQNRQTVMENATSKRNWTVQQAGRKHT